MSTADESRASMSPYSGVLQAVNGLRQRRAIAAMLVCLVAGVVVLALSARIGGVGAMLGALLFALAVATGVNAAGGLQLEAARGQAPRSLVDALTFGLMCIPRVLLLA